MPVSRAHLEGERLVFARSAGNRVRWQRNALHARRRACVGCSRKSAWYVARARQHLRRGGLRLRKEMAAGTNKNAHQDGRSKGAFGKCSVGLHKNCSSLLLNYFEGPAVWPGKDTGPRVLHLRRFCHIFTVLRMTGGPWIAAFSTASVWLSESSAPVNASSASAASCSKTG